MLKRSIVLLFGVAYLLFAVTTTVYILVAIRLEETDLVDSPGDAYREYRERVPMLIPLMPMGRSREG
jgi:protein-S-isoprenylcysteine O-methyltransferase Ste14